ncbi:hypothetical protein FN846DRAFT_366805 [Sphaerosporella brunnea]|uniref:Zn(2)-C6 fungal-type domain-containing protein n=1 Tax=Sphaerosporella brunnea TaxID=1250544 RepID=A0A5J5EGZ8_9PEZI|nr:hypothetical protein FN846DRAFT_366805 [Sphaerosporella brunnea]
MTTVVFAANNDSYRRRRRAHRACEQCKRRRRRCEPPFENHDRCAGCTRDSIACSLVPASNPNLPLSPAPPTPPADVLEPPNSCPRFVGDLNPESVFLTSSAAPQQRDLSSCGVWASPPPPIQPPSRPPQKIPQHMPRAYAAYLESIDAFSLPILRIREALLSIYFASVHPLLPVLPDESVFRAEHAKSTVSVPLLHAVLLVAARHASAARFLAVPQRRFADTTAQKVDALLHGGWVEKDRVTLVRIHALLALHSEGPGGNENASLHLSTAVHHAYSIGLHLARADIGAAEQRLWWCLWALDALQASLCGRPVGVRREDVSVPWPEAGGDAFMTFLNLAAMLTDVIALYRPGNTRKEWAENPWPSLSEVVPVGLPKDISDTLALFYHAVCILSHRTAGTSGGEGEASFIRRMNSAHAVLDLFPDAKATLPIVPYSVSLALSAFFSALRCYCDEQHQHLVRSCEILEDLGSLWWFAGAMARMGRQALERVVVKEAAGVLRCLGGEEEQKPEHQRALVDPVEDAGVEAWFLQLFPDLAFPASFGDAAGDGMWDFGGGLLAAGGGFAGAAFTSAAGGFAGGGGGGV